MKVYINKIIPKIATELFENAGITVLQDDQKENGINENLMQEADAFLNVGGIKINKDFLSKFPNIKAVSLFSVGYNQVDLAAVNSRKIPVGNTPEVLSRATSDVAFLLMQMVARYAVFNAEKVKLGNWKFFNPMENLGQELYGKTLGIFGLGRIGKEMAQKCKAAFGMEIIYRNRSKNSEAESSLGAKYVSFEDLLKNADVLSIHANFSDENKGLFNAEKFSQMKPNSIFINTARGGFVNENDLCEALKNKAIWGAGLDVTNPEPMSEDNPLLSLPNVCILPHIGSATVEARTGMAKLAAENLIAFFKNEKMPHCVNPEIFDGSKVYKK